jgi:hypothetical protein
MDGLSKFWVRGWHFLKKHSWETAIAGVAGLLVVSAVLTAAAVWRVALGDWQNSRILFKLAKPISWSVSRLTLRSVPLAEMWYEGVWLGEQASQLAGQSIDQPLEQILTELPDITLHTQQFAKNFQQSVLLPLVINDYDYWVRRLLEAQQYLTLSSALIDQQGHYLVLLQNTDEVRATGGFIGSYTVVDFSQANPFELEIRDIYDPSGISFTVPSPAGHAQYLSDGTKLMRLHDANWSPDFPSSAQLILRFFTKLTNDPQTYDGVIAVPLSVIEDLLAAVGEVYVTDQQRAVAADNLAEIIRQDRQSFFPGSQEKQQSLQAFYTALMVKLTQLSPGEWQQLVLELLDSQTLQQLQLYAKDQAVEQQVRAAGLDGALEAYSPQELYLFPVESNVGINKANRRVERSLEVSFDDQLLTVTTQFTNRFTKADRPQLAVHSNYQVADHLAYVNYYRLLVRSDMRVRQVLVDGQPLAESKWHERIIVSDDGTSYLQLGLLVVVSEDGQAVTQVTFAVPANIQPKLVLQQQIGISYDQVIWQCSGENSQQLTANYHLYRGICDQAVE